MERVLLAYKALNFNILNLQATGIYHPRTVLDYFDEIGMMVYDLNPYEKINYDMPKDKLWILGRSHADVPKDLKLHPWSLNSVENYFYRIYNHPSIVLFAVSSEHRAQIYEKSHRATYELVKRIDGQGRPICACSGGAPSRAIFNFTDVGDIHTYPGDINGHPWDHKQLLYDYNKHVWGYIGKNIIHYAKDD